MDSINRVAAGFESPEMVTINLEDGGKFSVEKALLCKTSSYFANALQGNFSESKTLTLTLPGCDTPTFDLLHWWMTWDFSQLAADLLADHEWADLQIHLVSLWFLGDFLDVPRLQNDALRRLDAIIGDHSAPAVGAIKAIFTHDAEASTLREYIIGKAAAVCRARICFGADGDCRCCYSAADHNELGAIPGVFKEMASVLCICAAECEHKDHDDPAHGEGHIEEYYLVPEKEDR